MKHNLRSMTLLSLSLVAATASAYDFVVDGIYYNILSENTVAVTNDKDASKLNTASRTYSGTLTIPASVTSNNVTYSVTEVGDYAFYDCYTLKKLTLPEGIASIGESAFDYCSQLTDIDFPTSIMHIHYSALEQCKWYNQQEDGKVIVGSVLYRYKGNREYTGMLYVDDGVKVIGHGAFLGQRYLDEITLPYGLERVEVHAFAYTGLESIDLGNQVTYIGESAFEGSQNLRYINGLYAVTEVGKDAFKDTPWLASQSDGPFYVGSVLVGYLGTMPANYHLDISSGTKSISPYAFYYNNNLAEVTIPTSLETIGADAFSACWNLKRVNLPSIEKWLSVKLLPSTGVWTYGSNPMCCGAKIYVNNTEITDLAIPEGTTVLPAGCFYNARHFNSLTLPASLQEIGEYALHISNQNPLKCRALTPPVLNKSSIRGMQYNSNDVLYVPAESVDLYKNNTQGWETWVIKPLNAPKPTIRLVDNELHFECDAKNVSYQYSFQLLGDNQGSGTTKTGIVKLSNKLKVTVQAFIDGLEPSEVVEKEIQIDPYDLDGDGKTSVTDVTKVVEQIVKSATK